MVDIIPASQKRSTTERFLSGIANAMPGIVDAGKQLRQENLLQKENKQLGEMLGMDLKNIRDPAIRQTLIQEMLPLVMKRKLASSQAEGMQNYIDKLKGKERETSRQEMSDMVSQTKPREALPEFNVPGRKSTPSKSQELIGAPSEYGQMPQPLTFGVTEKLTTPQDFLKNSIDLSNQLTSAGYPITPQEASNILANIENQKILQGQQTELERQQRTEAQNKYGQLSEDMISKYFPNASEELKSMFRKYGEEEATEKGATEATIRKNLANKARIFTDRVEAIKSSLPAPRVFQKFINQVMGTDREFDKLQNDMRIKLKPLLDKGLYNETREILHDLGYGPEETEATIFDLNPYAKQEIAKLPDLKKKEKFVSTYSKPFPEKQAYTPEQKEQIVNTIRNVFKKDPNTNLILLRKAFEEKGVDWNEFKDALNELELNKEIKLEADQETQRHFLDSPPLSNLGKILKGLNIIGK